METQTQIRFDAAPEAPADHLTKPEGCLPTTTGPPKHRTAHLKEKKSQAKCWAVQHRCTDIGKGNTKGYLLRLCSTVLLPLFGIGPEASGGQKREAGIGNTLVA